MKTVFDVLRHPLVIGALVLSIFIVVGVYFGSHWYYGDVEPVEMLEVSTPTPALPEKSASSEVDLSGLQGESLPTQTKLTTTPIIGVEGESVDDFLAELSEEEKALLMAEVVEETQPVSPFGFGPYPEVPSDFPHDPIWADPDYPEGDEDLGSDFMREMELMNRVLIKLWNQGRRVSSASMSDGLVYPGYPDTVYVTWKYIEEPDGTMTRYASEISSGPAVPLSVHDAIREEGTIPYGIKELNHDADGIDPYTFLNLN